MAPADPSRPRKRGRPTLYRDVYAGQSERLCLLGATDADLAAFFEVDEATVNRWKREHPEFCESLKAGKQQADARVAESLYRRALGYEHDAVKIAVNTKTGDEYLVPYVERYPPDTTAAIFWLKNRRPDLWRDKQQLEHTGKDGAPIAVDVAGVRERVAERLARRIAAATPPREP